MTGDDMRHVKATNIIIELILQSKKAIISVHMWQLILVWDKTSNLLISKFFRGNSLDSFISGPRKEENTISKDIHISFVLVQILRTQPPP